MVSFMKIPIFLLNLSTGISGLWAAWLWYKASEVKIVPLWARLGASEPADPETSRGHWIDGLIEAANLSASLNKLAALWTGISIGAASLSGFIGMLF